MEFEEPKRVRTLRQCFFFFFFFLRKRTLPLSACCRKTKQVWRFRVASCISGHVVSADVSPKYMNVMAWENAVSYVQPDAITPNFVGPAMLGVVASVLAVVSKRTQQLAILSGQQCWELLRSCWQWCPNGRNNSQRHTTGWQTDATCNIQQYWELRAIQQCCVRLPRALQGQGRQNQAALSPSKFFGQLFVKIKTKIPRSVGELRFIRIVFIVGSEMKILKVFLD